MQNERWYLSGRMTVLMLVVCPPAGLILLWRSPSWTRSTKLVAAIFAIAWVGVIAKSSPPGDTTAESIGGTEASGKTVATEPPPRRDRTANRISDRPGDDRDNTHLVGAVPPGVVWKVVESESIPGVKQSLVVELNRRVSPETLESLAYRLRGAPGRYQRTFILYFLPGQDRNAGAWATTHFNPDLHVSIQGFTGGEAAAAKAEAPQVSGVVLGTWFDELPPSQFRLVGQGNGFFMERRFTDGSSLVERVREERGGPARRFVTARSSDDGVYYLLRPDGFMDLCDQDGLITRLRPEE